MSARATDGNYWKNFCQSIQKRRREGKREKKMTRYLPAQKKGTRTATATHFALDANAEEVMKRLSVGAKYEVASIDVFVFNEKNARN